MKEEKDYRVCLNKESVWKGTKLQFNVEGGCDGKV